MVFTLVSLTEQKESLLKKALNNKTVCPDNGPPNVDQDIQTLRNL